MMKTLLLSIAVLLTFAAKSQSQDTLKVKYTLSCSDRYSRDTIMFKTNGDTLIITENKWKGIPSKPIAIRSYLHDTLVVALADTGKGFLTADCRVITTIKIPNAFRFTKNLKFQGKVFPDYIVMDGLTANLAESQEIKIYPNPAKNVLNIESPEIFNSILIHNALGEKISVINNFTTSINLENYPSGMYYASFFTLRGVVKRVFYKF